MLSEEFAPNYVLKRLVFVNSASHGYSEILLDEHLAMFGNNNRGKTASLAAMKLLLYPEDNFNHCERKFNFTSKSGKQYDKFESYDYYFPTPNSFLLLEVQNPIGTFCMILYRASDFKYHRFFIQKSYDDLRHLFWESETQNFANDLGIEGLKQAVKYWNGLHITNKNDLEKIMYANYANVDSQFCIVPLKDNQSSSIKAFTSIFELAFNSGKGEEKALPDAIATIIEMQRGRDEEKLEANFDKLQQEYQELYDQGQHLQNLSNHQDIYQRLKATHDTLVTEHKNYSLQYSILVYQLNQEKDNYGERFLAINQKIEAKEPLVKELKAQRQKKIATQSELAGKISNTEDNISQQKTHKNSVEKYLSEQALNIQDAENILTTQIDDLEERLSAIQDVENAHQSLKKKQSQRSEKQKEIERLTESLENLSTTMVAQLSQASASVLTTLNSQFANVLTEISDHEQQTIEQFTAFFNESQNQLSFKDRPLGLQYRTYNVEQQKEQLQQQYDQAQKKLLTLNEQINGLQNIIHNSNDQNLTAIKLQDIQQSLAQRKNLRKEVRGYSGICDELEKNQHNLEKLLVDQIELSNLFKVELEVFLVESGELEQLFDARKSLDRDSEKFADIAQMLHKAHQASPVTYISEGKVDFKHMVQTMQLTKQNAGSIADKAHDIKFNTQSFMAEFMQFLKSVPLKDVDPYIVKHQLHECGDIFGQYKNLFETLSYLKAVLSQQISAHNHYLNNMIQEIENANKILRGMVHDMNQILAVHAISNFASVKLHLVLNTDFETLLDNCRKHDISENSLMESSFYEMLLNYIQNHFNHRSHRIRMVDLIKEIHYQYLDHDNKVETKAQSGGTTSTVTSLIISILLHKILRVEHTLRIPIVIDEIADIDTHNMKNIVAQITRAGFSIFCATPTFSATVCMHIGGYILIDSCQLKVERHSPKCELHIMPMHINRLGLMQHEN